MTGKQQFIVSLKNTPRVLSWRCVWAYVALTDHTCRVPSAEPAAAWRSSAPRQARHQTPPTWKLGARSVRCTWKLRQSVSFSRLSLPQVSTTPAQPEMHFWPESRVKDLVGVF